MSSEKRRGPIFFDASLVSTSRMDGLNRYSTAILKRIDQKDVVFIANRKTVKHFGLARFIMVPVRFSEPGLMNNLYRLVWRSVVLPLYILLYRPSLFYSPIHEGQTFPLVKQVITIHDFLPFLFPQAYPRLRYFFAAFFPIWIRGSSRIICVSRSTYRDLIERYPFSPRAHIISEGVDYSGGQPKDSIGPESISQVMKKFNIAKPYVLMVAEHRLYKNTAGGIRGFHRLDDPSVCLVLVGKASRLSTEMVGLPDRLGIADRVIFTGFVSDEDLKCLYAGASVFMLPSLYEGFGLPLLEAMESGCPSIVSGVSSLPEVGGDAAFYFDPLDPQDIADALRGALYLDRQALLILKSKMADQARRFSFDFTARDLQEVFHDTLR